MFERYLVPISVKGIVFEDGKVWLRQNERNEWELPGGKLDKGEQPTETVIREIKEELGLEVLVGNLIQAYLYSVKQSTDEQSGVMVISYLCTIKSRVGDFEYEGEAGHAEFKLFSLSEIEALTMPNFYKDAIREASSF